jgi:hypothetical protein
VPYLAFGRFRAVFDFGEQLGFNPDAFMRDALGIGLSFSDQGRKALSQIGGGSFVKAMVDLAGID